MKIMKINGGILYYFTFYIKIILNFLSSDHDKYEIIKKIGRG